MTHLSLPEKEKIYPEEAGLVSCKFWGLGSDGTVGANKNTVETLPIGQLNNLISQQKLRGDSNVMYALIEKHTRYALPFSAFILTIMGVSLSSRKRRGGIGLNIGIGIALSFTYILFLRFSQMFVYSGAMAPAVALWLPNLIFGIIAAFLYSRASK